MAKSKTRSDSDTPVSKSTDKTKPSKWWQWMLLYPTLAISILTAAPQWTNMAKGFLQDVDAKDVAMLELNNSLWTKNVDCTKAPYEFFENPNNIKVDATICKSGDILVLYFLPDGQQFSIWVPVSEVTKKTASLGIIPSAHAEGNIQLAQQSANVICQKFEDAKTLYRHVRVGSVCFDERINTLTGQRISRTPAPCKNAC